MESLSPLLCILLRTSSRYSFFLLLFYLFQPPPLSFLHASQAESHKKRIGVGGREPDTAVREPSSSRRHLARFRVVTPVPGRCHLPTIFVGGGGTGTGHRRRLRAFFSNRFTQPQKQRHVKTVSSSGSCENSWRIPRRFRKGTLHCWLWR